MARRGLHIADLNQRQPVIDRRELRRKRAALDKMKNPKALSRMAEKEENTGRKRTLLDAIRILESQKRDRCKRLADMGIRKTSGKEKWKRKRHRGEHDRIDRIHSQIGGIMRELRNLTSVCDSSGAHLPETRDIKGELAGIKRDIADAGKSRRKWSAVIERLCHVCSKTEKLFLNHEFREMTKVDAPNGEDVGIRLYGSDVHQWSNSMMSCRRMYEKLNGNQASF